MQRADTGGSKRNIWESAILLHYSGEEDSSQYTCNTMVETVGTDTRPIITSLTVDPQDDAVFCSKNDGSVNFYNLRTGNKIRTLHRRKINIHNQLAARN